MIQRIFIHSMHFVLSILLVAGCGAAKPEHKNKNAAEGRLPKSSKTKASPTEAIPAEKPADIKEQKPATEQELPAAPQQVAPQDPAPVVPDAATPEAKPVVAPSAPPVTSDLPLEGQLPSARPIAPAPEAPVILAPNPDPFDQSQQLPPKSPTDKTSVDKPKVETPKIETPKVNPPVVQVPEAKPRKEKTREEKTREEKSESQEEPRTETQRETNRAVLPKDWIPVGWELRSKNGREWSRIAVSIIRQKAPLFYRGSEDMDEFCPSFQRLEPAQKENVWVALISAVAKHESNFDPYTRYYEKKMNRLDLVTGEPLHSEGLLQLSYQDSKSFPKFCSEIDWERDQDLDDKSSSKTIFNPRINLKCGIQVLHRQIGKHNRIAVPKNKAYWAVLIPKGSHSKLRVIQETVKTLPFCRSSAD